MTLAEKIKEKALAFLRSRAQNYRTTFLNPSGEDVLRDLAKFCRAHESTFHQYAPVSDKLDGRREVWLRIQSHLRLTDEQLWKMYGKNPS